MSYEIVVGTNVCTALPELCGWLDPCREAFLTGMARKEQLPFSVAYGVGLVLASAQKIINPVLLQYFFENQSINQPAKIAGQPENCW